MFDILLCNHLKFLNDTASQKHLHVVSEVKLEFFTTIESIRKKVSECCDWALRYINDRSKLQKLLIVQTKSPENIRAALPQLLTYLTSVHAARSTANKTNNVIFGLITDSIHFQFAVLRDNKRLFLSNYLCWWNEKAVIVTFLDHILRDAIEPSSHATPTRSSNRRIGKFDESLAKTYNFGDHVDDND